jgi:tetratricopeptide (TPR) repeat protein
MSPEQSLAKRVVVDHRTDIYSLGVTLYELLTLRPAFDGQDRQELLRQVAFEEPRAPRRLNKAIPAELETIALKAVEKNPADRYATAQELADDLRHFLEDRPIQARRPGLLQRLTKWCRRHPSFVTATALVLVVTTLVLTVSNVLIWRANKERAEALLLQRLNESEFATVREDYQGAIKQNQAALQRVLLSLGRVVTEVDRLKEAPDPQHTAAREAVWAAALGCYESMLPYKDTTGPDYPAELPPSPLTTELAWAHVCAGNLYTRRGEFDKAATAYRKAWQLIERIVSVQTVRLPANGAPLRGPGLPYTRWLVRPLADVLEDRPEVEKGYRRALAIWREKSPATLNTVTEYRSGQVTLWTAEGCRLWKDGQKARAERAWDQALAIQKKIAADWPTTFGPHLALRNMYQEKGDRLRAAGQLEEAAGAYLQERVEIKEVLAGFPERWPPYFPLTVFANPYFRRLLERHRAFGRFPEADQVYQAVRDGLREMFTADPRTFGRRLEAIPFAKEFADLLSTTGRPQEAKQLLGEVLALLERFDQTLDNVPALPARVPGRVRAHLLRAQLLARVDRPGEAEAEYRRFIARCESGEYPGQVVALGSNDFAWFLATCPDARFRSPAQAREQARRAVGASPNDATCWNTLGVACYRCGDWSGAIETFKSHLRGNSFDFFFLAMAHWRLGEKEEARRWWEKAVQWMDDVKPWDEELRRFRAEAAALLGVND